MYCGSVFIGASRTGKYEGNKKWCVQQGGLILDEASSTGCALIHCSRENFIKISHRRSLSCLMKHFPNYGHRAIKSLHDGTYSKYMYIYQLTVTLQNVDKSREHTTIAYFATVKITVLHFL